MGGKPRRRYRRGHQCYNPQTGFLEGIKTIGSTGTIQDAAYQYDPLGNLEKRQDLSRGLTETFGYDQLNRLTSSNVVSQASKAYTYSAAGNILSKTGVGTYTYGGNGAGPHAVNGITGGFMAQATSYTYDANGNMLTGGGRTIQYASHNKPSVITTATTTLSYTYGPRYPPW